MTTRFVLSAVLLFAVSPISAADSPESVYPHAVVAADHPLASQAGREMLRRGGNVVDAAVAAAFTLSVVRPASSGIGGGGFLVFWDAESKRGVALDYRERAPRKATRDMYLRAAGEEQDAAELSRKGALSVAVPGDVAGLCHAVEVYGTLDLKTVLQPALRAAREGIIPDEHDRNVRAEVLRDFAQHPEYRARFRTLYDQYLNGGRPLAEDERFHSPQLKVLERIAEQGARAFYTGPVAEALVAEVRRGGGVMTLDDLAAMRPVVREPLTGMFDSERVVTMPPPSSGGVALLESLNILTAYEAAHPDLRLDALGHNSPAYVHLLTEAMKHAFADRAEFLGDADFVDVPVRRLTSRQYAKELAGRIDPQRTKPPESYGRFLPVDDGGTSHISVIDSRGNAVACTETVNTLYGSYVVEPHYGIVLNDEMDDFAAVPGKPNAFGLIQSEKNAIAPGKKPLSSMTPTILVDESGRAVFVAGASGGPRIISATLQVLLNMMRFDMTPAAAVAAPRMHHQWLPNVLLVEPPLEPRVREELEQRGHKVARQKSLAVSQAAARTAQGIRGASDPRKHGQPAGY